VAVLRSRSFEAYDSAAAGFRSSFKGAVESFSLEDPDAGSLPDRIGRLRPDAIVAVGLRGAVYARDHFPRMPIVFCAVQDPDRNELNGAWITGVSTEIAPAAEIAAWRMIAPDVHRVALFYGAATGTAFARVARQAARASGIELVEVPVKDLSEFGVRARDVAPHVDALWLPADATVAAREAFQFLLGISLQRRIPLFVFSDALVRAGALAAVAPDFTTAGAQAAEAVRRIQSGERAGDIPVIAVRRTRLVINEATARALGRDLSLAARRESEVVR
jgi:putative ABC transport system substrate-binding protein